MSRDRRMVLVASALLLALAACATTPPFDPAMSPTPTPPATSATPTPTPSVTPATPSSAPSDEGANLTLRGDGLGEFSFGAKQVDVGELLSDQLGEPDETSQGILCEFDDASPWAQTAVYGGLWVQYTAKNRSKTSGRFLAAWGFNLTEEFAEPLAMADGVPLDLTFTELKARYPGGKLENLNLGEGDGSRMFTLPNKIRFIGVTNPEMVSAGRLAVCE